MRETSVYDEVEVPSNCSSRTKLHQSHHVKNYTSGKQTRLKLETLNSKMCFQDTDFSSLYELQFNGKRNSQQILKTFIIFYYEIVFQIVKTKSLSANSQRFYYRTSLHRKIKKWICFQKSILNQNYFKNLFGILISNLYN